MVPFRPNSARQQKLRRSSIFISLLRPTNLPYVQRRMSKAFSSIVGSRNIIRASRFFQQSVTLHPTNTNMASQFRVCHSVMFLFRAMLRSFGLRLTSDTSGRKFRSMELLMGLSNTFLNGLTSAIRRLFPLRTTFQEGANGRFQQRCKRISGNSEKFFFACHVTRTRFSHVRSSSSVSKVNFFCDLPLYNRGLLQLEGSRRFTTLPVRCKDTLFGGAKASARRDGAIVIFKVRIYLSFRGRDKRDEVFQHGISFRHFSFFQQQDGFRVFFGGDLCTRIYRNKARGRKNRFTFKCFIFVGEITYFFRGLRIVFRKARGLFKRVKGSFEVICPT